MLTCQKDSFILPPGLHYLNCSYLGPLLKSVERAGHEGVSARRDPRSFTPGSFFTIADEVRALFARLVNAPDPSRIAILPAVSYGISIAARNLAVGAGGSIVVAHEQFPSNVLAWRRLATERGLTLRTVAPAEGPARGESWNERLVAAIDSNTAIVALGGVHWADGTRFDLAAIGARAREVGAALVVDGTQSVGAVPFDVADLRPDLLVCAAYKWLLGPYGLALAYLGPRFDDGVPLEENWINREGSDDFTALVRYRDEYRPGAVRYDVGERSNPVLLPMAAAALRALLEWGPDRISEYCAGLLRPMLEILREEGYGVEEERWRSPHMTGVRLPPHIDAAALSRELERRNISVSVRGDAVRISPNVHCDAGDIAALREAMLGRG
jgi:selenocysteine lyase/cysteine desulfurase